MSRQSKFVSKIQSECIEILLVYSAYFAYSAYKLTNSHMFLAIVPAHNEEKTIGSVVRNLFEHTDRVVVVDDGSDDATATVAESAGAEVLRHELNRGQGAALQTGHEYAQACGAEYVLHFDADGQFDVRDITPALGQLKRAQADVLFGSRFLDGRSSTPWFKKRVLLPAGRVVSRLFGGGKLTDTHNGFRILTKRALEKIRLTQDGMAHATEIQSLVKRHGLRYIEYPVKVTYTGYGQGIQEGTRIVRDLLFGKFV